MERLGIRHLGLVLIGIVLVVIGLIATFYYVELPQLFHFITHARFGYPYQTIGIILTIAGLVTLALGVSTHQERLSRQNRMRELAEKLARAS